MFRICKAFRFSASHQLSGLPQEHPCSRLHGHNYLVEVELQSAQVDGVGFVLDYRAMDAFKGWLNGVLDHRHLNDCMTSNPTAESLAFELFQQATRLLGDRVCAVRVRETDATLAEYRP